MGEIVVDANSQFFELPGIQDEIENFNRQLDASHDHLDHIVITGPTGVGKSQFVRIVKERLWNYKAENAEFKTVDCESFAKAKEELAGWKSFDANGNELIILENLECFPVEEFKALSALLKRVRVVATTRDELPGELIDYFKIMVEVPPLYERRDDIFYFIVAKYPELYLTNFDLVRLYAYNWPSNFRELDRVLRQLHTGHKLPSDIERKIPEEKLYGLFRTMYDNGLQETELSLTHDICFPHIVPKADHYYLELKFENNDSSCDIEMRLLGLPNTTLNFKKIQWIFRNFFCLIYGKGVHEQNQNIFDLEPFSKEALELIKEAQEDVKGWLGGDAHSEVENYNRCSILHFSNSLKWWEIDAVRAYLKACALACHVNTIKRHNEEPTLIMLDRATEEGQLDNFLRFTDLVKQLEPYGKTEHDIFCLAVKGELDIFAPVKAVTVLWYIVAIGTDYHDPQGEIEYRKTTYLPLTWECIETIANSKGKVKLHFDCPSALRPSELNTEEEYTSELRPLGWLRFDQHEWNQDKNVKKFSEGDKTQLYVRVEDKKRLETTLLSIPQWQSAEFGRETDQESKSENVHQQPILNISASGTAPLIDDNSSQEEQFLVEESKKMVFEPEILKRLKFNPSKNNVTALKRLMVDIGYEKGFNLEIPLGGTRKKRCLPELIVLKMVEEKNTKK